MDIARLQPLIALWDIAFDILSVGLGLYGLGIRPGGGVKTGYGSKNLRKALYDRSKASLKISDRLDEFS